MTTNGDVGSSKLFENDSIIMWEFVLEPGEATPMHSHHNDFLFYVLEGSPLQVITEDGKDLGTVMLNTGEVVAQRLEGDDMIPIDSERPPIPRTHKAVNVGPTRYREVLIEWKK